MSMTDADALTMPAATTAAVPGSNTNMTTEVAVDLHGFHPDEITGYPLESLIRQAWEMGVDRLRIVHGHGRNRPTGIPRGVCSTGFLGMRIRNELDRPSAEMRQHLGSTVFDRRDVGQTIVRLKKNPSPTRDALDLSVLAETYGRKEYGRRDYEIDLAWSQHLARTA